MRTNKELLTNRYGKYFNIDSDEMTGESVQELMKQAQIEILEHFCAFVTKSPLIEYKNEGLYLIDLKNELINKII